MRCVSDMDGSASITLHSRDQDAIAGRLGQVNSFLASDRHATVVWPEDLSQLGAIAAHLSSDLCVPALVVMTYERRILLYQLYESGQLTDAYVSEAHADLTDGSAPPPGSAERLCEAFGRERFKNRVEQIL